MDIAEHHRFAGALRAAVTGTGRVTPAVLRGAVMARAAGGVPVGEPYDALARQIAEAADRVTDGEVDAVRVATGSERGAFEVVMSASIGAGLARWDAAVRAIEGASDATA